MRTTSPDYKSLTPVDEKAYRADLDIADRYQQSVQEILRLALLGIAGYGFLLGKVVFSVKDTDDDLLFFDGFLDAKIMIIVGAGLFALSAGAALLHKHYTTECLNHHVRRIRLNTDPYDSWSRRTMERENESLRHDLKMCRILFVAASAALWLGVVMIVVVFTIVLW